MYHSFWFTYPGRVIAILVLSLQWALEYRRDWHTVGTGIIVRKHVLDIALAILSIWRIATAVAMACDACADPYSHASCCRRD